jgi:hypothetical protein
MEWHRFHEKGLPELLSNPLSKSQINNMINYHMRTLGGLVDEASLPEIQWISDEPVVRSLTGGNFTVPVMEFPEHLMPIYEHMCGRSMSAATFTLPIELISLGQLNIQQSINSQMILIPHRGRVSKIPYSEKRSHEFTHAIDPHVDTREMPGNIVMREIIAIIGSYSDTDFNKMSQIVLYPPYIVPYIIQELQLKGVEEISDADLDVMVNMVNGIVYKSTHIIPKLSNDQITRRIMKCKSFDELQQTWPELFR